MLELVVLAEASADPLAFLLNFGTLGVMFVLLLTGQLYTKPYVSRLEKECATKDQVIEVLRTQISTSVIPGLERTARVMEQVPNSGTELAAALKELTDKIESAVSDKAGSGP